jgi:hypothetical protein
MIYPGGSGRLMKSLPRSRTELALGAEYLTSILAVGFSGFVLHVATESTRLSALSQKSTQWLFDHLIRNRTNFRAV